MADRVDGIATVITVTRTSHENANQGEAHVHDVVLDWAFGKERYTAELEVQPPAGAPYRVRGEYAMPNRAGGLKRLGGRGELVAGAVLPVRIAADDPHDVEIDWKRFAKAGGFAQLNEAAEAAAPARATDARREHFARRPKELEKRRKSVLPAAQMQADAVRSGHLTPAQFEEWIGEEAAIGVLTPEEVEGFRRAAGLSSPPPGGGD